MPREIENSASAQFVGRGANWVHYGRFASGEKKNKNPKIYESVFIKHRNEKVGR